MPSTYSSNLRLELQATGENTSTWGVRANNDFELIEDAIAGLATVAMGNANVSLSALNGATDQSRNMFVSLTGANTAIRVVTIPSVSKLYFIGNFTSGGFDIQVKTAAGAALNIANGVWSIVNCDGTNCNNIYDINALRLNGQLAAYYTNSSNQNAGTLADARLPTILSSKGIGVAPNASKFNASTPGIAFGDDDTGIRQNGDGQLEILTNNVVRMIINGVGAASINGGSVWTGVNQGPGTGMNADLLDGMHAADILAAAASFPSGTRIAFQQTSAPTGWTKDTTHNNKAMRLVSGTVTSGGSVAFTSAFTSQGVSGSISSVAAGGTVGSYALTTADLPSHSHDWGNLSGFTNTTGDHSHTFPTRNDGSGGTGEVGLTNPGATSSKTTSTTGNHSHTVTINSGSTGFTGSNGGHSHSFSGASHNHTFTGNAINLDVQYVDFIICQKN